MIKLIFFVLSFLLALIDSKQQQILSGDTRVKQLTVASNEFAFKLHRTFGSNGNVFWSPVSVFTALGMLYTGARTITAEEMRLVLFQDIAGFGDKRINKDFQALILSLAATADEGRLEIANAIITRDRQPVLREYKQTLRDFYRAVVKDVDLKTSTEDLIRDVNGWITRKTYGKINRLLDTLDYDTVLVMLNAVYFKGAWKKPFLDILTDKGAFYNYGIYPTNVPMMVQENHFFYGNFPEYGIHALKMPYLGDKFSMVILLPLQRNGLHQVEVNLTPYMLDNVVTHLRNQNVIIKLPRFKLEDSRKMRHNLAMLGMKTAFTNKADFSGIIRDANLKVSKIVHKAMVEVNEAGTEAASATGVVGIPKILEEARYFFVEHPFLFFIRDDIKGTVVFFGRVNEL